MATQGKKTAVKEPGVVVIVPLYNEEAVIADVVDGLRHEFSTVVCVDDGSSDRSAAVAEVSGATVIRHPYNLGQGAALQTGIVYARNVPTTEYVVTFDADGQHRVEDAVGMLAVAREKNLAIVFGSRFLDRRTQPGFAKKTVLKVAVFITRLVTGMKLTDAHNGLRVIRRDALDSVNLIQDRMSHATEIVQQLAKSDKRWREYPVEVLYTEYSKKKGQSLLNSINILFDLIVR